MPSREEMMWLAVIALAAIGLVTVIIKSRKKSKDSTPPTAWEIPVLSDKKRFSSPEAARRAAVASTLAEMQTECQCPEDEELYRQLKHQRQAGYEEIDLDATLPGLSSRVTQLFRDHVALQGNEPAYLQKLLTLRPDLKDEQFSTRMRRIYTLLTAEAAQNKWKAAAAHWSQLKALLD